MNAPVVSLAPSSPGDVLAGMLALAVIVIVLVLAFRRRRG